MEKNLAWSVKNGVADCRVAELIGERFREERLRVERPRGERLKGETGRGQDRKAKSGYCCSNFTMVMRLLLNPGYTK